MVATGKMTTMRRVKMILTVRMMKKKVDRPKVNMKRARTATKVVTVSRIQLPTKLNNREMVVPLRCQSKMVRLLVCK